MIIDNMQQQAIEHKDGPMMVLAGPGSGKTTVIIHRVKYLIEEHHVNPANILVITFTRAAATEMKERFHQLINDGNASCSGTEAYSSNYSHYPVTFGTFHAIFFPLTNVPFAELKSTTKHTPI